MEQAGGSLQVLLRRRWLVSAMRSGSPVALRDAFGEYPGLQLCLVVSTTATSPPDSDTLSSTWVLRFVDGATAGSIGGRDVSFDLCPEGILAVHRAGERDGVSGTSEFALVYRDPAPLSGTSLVETFVISLGVDSTALSAADWREGLGLLLATATSTSGGAHAGLSQPPAAELPGPTSRSTTTTTTTRDRNQYGTDALDRHYDPYHVAEQNERAISGDQQPAAVRDVRGVGTFHTDNGERPMSQPSLPGMESRVAALEAEVRRLRAAIDEGSSRASFYNPRGQWPGGEEHRPRAPVRSSRASLSVDRTPSPPQFQQVEVADPTSPGSSNLRQPQTNGGDDDLRPSPSPLSALVSRPASSSTQTAGLPSTRPSTVTGGMPPRPATRRVAPTRDSQQYPHGRPPPSPATPSRVRATAEDLLRPPPAAGYTVPGDDGVFPEPAAMDEDEHHRQIYRDIHGASTTTATTASSSSSSEDASLPIVSD